MRNPQVEEFAVKLFLQESDRDRQRKVGASQISDPCTRHLARALVNDSDGQSKYWLGAKLGTATHMFLEDCIEKATLVDFPEVEGAIVEKKITLGELDGYGTINSKPDLVLPKEKHLIDWKTSKRDKSRKLQNYLEDPANGHPESDYTISKYMAQTQLYAWGMNKEGVEVENISLVFINRDGTSSNDVWAHTFEYNEEFAVAVWDRLVSLWAELQAGKTPDEFEGNPNCFKCKVGK